jgi:hypothetical protein
MNWWEALIINAAAGMVRTFVKNPKNAAAFEAVLQHIYDDLGTVLAALKATEPTGNVIR